MFIVSFLKFSPETTKTYQGIANNYTCDNILNTTSNNTTTCKHNNISKRKQLSLSLSPPQRSLLCPREAGERKKRKCTRDDGKGKGRREASSILPFPSSLCPLHASSILIAAMFCKIPNMSHCGGEKASHTNLQCLHGQFMN